MSEVRKTFVKSWRHSWRRAIGFTFFITGAMAMCLGVYIAGGREALTIMVEEMDYAKFWQGKN